SFMTLIMDEKECVLLTDFNEKDYFVDYVLSLAAEENNFKAVDERVIENYQKDEQMMILIFAQWCVNNEVDANELYKRAYPEQASNQLLANIFKETLEAGKSDQVDDTTVFSVLEIFGNSDLAFEVQGVIDKRKQ